MQPNTLEVLKARYFLKDSNGQPIEDWEGLCDRTASRAADGILETNREDQRWVKLSNDFYHIQHNQEFIANSPVYFNVGTKHEMGSACFIIPVGDSISDIYGAVRNGAMVEKMGGGIGMDFSQLRPTNTMTSVGGKASGALSFMTAFDTMTQTIKQGGKRRGAMMATMDVTHPEILNFIDCKEKTPTERVTYLQKYGLSKEQAKDVLKDLDWRAPFSNFNITVKLTDEFMTSWKEDGLYNLVNPNGTLYTGPLLDPRNEESVSWRKEEGKALCLHARKVMERIIEKAWQSGEPGIGFIDRINRDNPVASLSKIYNPNPCGEFWQISYSSCNLGSINLSKFVIKTDTHPHGRIDFEKMAKVTRLAVRFLEGILTINQYPIPEVTEVTKSTRPIGLGIMGFADLLLKMGVRYGSEQSIKLAEDVMLWIEYHAWLESAQIAVEKGAFRHYNDNREFFKNKFQLLDKAFDKRFPEARREGLVSDNQLTTMAVTTGVRHCQVTTIAPTGTISLFAECSAGCEPIYAFELRRQDTISTREYTHWFLEEWEKEHTGQILPDYAVEAHDVTPAEHILIQEAFQKYSDNGISKCLAKGSLILTNKGILPIEDLGNARGTDKFDDPLCDDLKVLCPDGNWRKVESHYSGGIKPTIRMHIDNGGVLEGSKVHKVMTLGHIWKDLQDINIGDYVMLRQSISHNNLGCGELPDSKAFRTSKYRHMRIPRRMSVELASWLGALCADGSTTESTGAISLTCANDIVERTYVELTNRLFGVHPKPRPDLRTKDTRSLTVNVRHLCRWVEGLIGKGAGNKHVPKEILCGSREEQIAFLQGISLDGYKAKNETYLYFGKSKRIANEVFSICHALGLAPYKATKYVKSGGYYIHGVSVEGFTGCWESHKDSNGNNQYLRREITSTPTLEVSHPAYSSVRHWKQEKQKVAFDKTLSLAEVEIDRNFYLAKVKNITFGESEVYDITVEGSHDYLVDGVWSHNTINLPENSTKEDVRTAYMMAWDHNLKSVTVYRDGCREGVLLHKDKKESKPTVKPQVIEVKPPADTNGNYMHRPEFLPGGTWKVKAPGGTVYVTVSWSPEENRIIEVFVRENSGNEAWELAGRLLSVLFRSGMSTKQVTKQLLRTRGQSTIVLDGQILTSVAQAIAVILEEAEKYFSHPVLSLLETPAGPDEEEIVVEGPLDVDESKQAVRDRTRFLENLCPDCGGKTLYKTEGCTKCIRATCGFNRCGG